MAVKQISENKYRVSWTTEKCEVRTNCSLEQVQDLYKRVAIIGNAYPPMWSSARRLHWQFVNYKESVDSNIWWVIVDPVIRYNNPREYEG